MKTKISIIGGGTSGLATAAFLDPNKFDVTIYEKGKVVGRKFLVAGDGGLNLTYKEPLETFVQKYNPKEFLLASLQSFPPEQMRQWLKEIGIPTFASKSHRVFPEEEMKPIQVLNAIINEIQASGHIINTNASWQGWGEKNNIKIEEKVITSDIVIFALGGGSWKVTGSSGDWISSFRDIGITCHSLFPSNCGYGIVWPSSILNKIEGQPLKNITISCQSQTKSGEVVITKMGLEGSAIYSLSPQIRDQLRSKGKATISIDFKPSFTTTIIKEKIQQSTSSTTDALRNRLKLNKSTITLLKTFTSKEEYLDLNMLASKIKSFPLEIVSTDDIDVAISTVGGVARTEVDKNFQLKKISNQYCIGEMLDWDAPTGGYLLQACFSMGHYLAHHLNTTL